MSLPFSAREFFEVFGRYNEAVWPAQLILLGIAVWVVIGMLRHEHARLILVLLAALWLWAGLVYHLTFFVSVNPAAVVFGVLFVAQALIFVSFAGTPLVRADRVSPGARVAGRALVAYAVLGYPLLGYMAGHHYPETPTFGAPCPVTIFTLGVLLWFEWNLPRWTLAIPLVWALIGTSAALQLSVPQDYGLAVAAFLSLFFGLLARTRWSKKALHA
jgi:hypothetical protein